MSCIMPVVHPYVPGAAGKGHGNDYYIEKPELAYLMSAKWQFSILYILLSDNAMHADEFLFDFTPRYMPKEKYFEAHDELNSVGDGMFYDENGNVYF